VALGTHLLPPFLVVSITPRAPEITARDFVITLIPYSVVFAGDGCISQTKPPLLVRRMAPSLPMAQPCCLSGANLMALIVLPCGRGFCHCQPTGNCCAIREAGSARKIQAQVNRAAPQRSGTRTDNNNLLIERKRVIPAWTTGFIYWEDVWINGTQNYKDQLG
jgi:hypothetical protein